MEGDNQDFQVFQNSKIFSTKYLAELHQMEEDRIHQSFIGIQFKKIIEFYFQKPQIKTLFED